MSVQIQFDQDALRPVVRLAVAAVMDRMEEEQAKFNRAAEEEGGEP